MPLSNPGSDPEVSLESGEHGTLLGRESDELGTLEQGDCHVAVSCRTVTSCHAVVSCHSTASASRGVALRQSQRVAVVLPIYG